MKFLLTLSVMSAAVANTSAFVPSVSNDIQKISSSLSAYSAEQIKQITASTERSPSLPFMIRPQKCKGYVGDVGFDPCYFSDRWSMEYLREAELKHGRVCMLAWTGWVAVDLGFRVQPIPEGWENLNSLSAHDALVVSSISDKQGWWYSPLAYILYLCAIPELFQFGRVNEMMSEGYTSRAAGDLSWDFFGFLKGQSSEYVEQMKLKEIKHARLGMLAFGGVVAQSVLGADSFPYISFSASSLS